MRQSNSDWRYAQKVPLPLSLHPVPQQDDELEFVESNDDDVCAAVDIVGFNATASWCMVIWGRIDQIQAVTHRFSDVEPAHSAELQVSFRHHSLEYSRGLLYVTAVQPVVNTLDPFHFLDCNEKKNCAARGMSCRNLERVSPPQRIEISPLVHRHGLEVNL